MLKGVLKAALTAAATAACGVVATHGIPTNFQSWSAVVAAICAAEAALFSTAPQHETVVQNSK